VISVTGGAQNFDLHHKLKDVFGKGIVKAALSSSNIQLNLSNFFFSIPENSLKSFLSLKKMLG